MENERNTNNVENPSSPKEFNAQSFEVPMDTGNGLSADSSSVFHSEVGVDNDFNQYGPTDKDTLSFTQLGAAYVTPALTQQEDSIVPTPAYHGYTGTFKPSQLMNRRQARPTMYQRGTNWLIPLGGYDFIRFMGTTAVTAKGAIASVIPQMDALVPSLGTPGSYREVTHWKRLSELKNVIISYYNRSIPFTDLDVADRFAIEMCYMRDISFACMPIFAKAYALSLVQHWQKQGYQYDPSKLTNLNSLTCERIIKQIYAAVASLPSMDDVHMSRMVEFSKPHTTAKSNGFTPTIMIQDWSIGSCGKYALSNVDVGSGYHLTTTLSSISDRRVYNATTFSEWLELWLRSDICSVDDLAAILNNILQLAQGIRTNYSILLGCAMQLEQKGALKYSTVAEFLPVTGVGEYYLNYKIPEVSFSYTFKERVEYAPRNAAGEDTSGNDTTFRFNIADLPNDATTDLTSTLVTRRPVGLYKGEKCWGTKEIVGIGLFKGVTASLQNSYFYLRTQLINNSSIGSSTVTFSAKTIGIRSAGGSYVDAYYGDVYDTTMIHVSFVGESATAATNWISDCELVSYYALAAPGAATCQNAPYTNLSSWARAGGTDATPLSIFDGSHILSFGNTKMSVNNAPTLLIMNQLIALFTQLDLTLYMSTVDKDASSHDTPIILFTNYRGCEFDEIDLAPVENACADSYRKMVQELKPKSGISERR